MSFHNLGPRTILCGAISVALSPAGWAGEPASVRLEEIVVTAQRTETNLQQTPVSVAAISGAALDEQGANNLQDLAHFIPNLEVGSVSLQGGGNGRFAIRGIGQDAFVSPSVGLYIDEVYYSSGAGNMVGLFDVERIEVLRGPQGTLFGRNAIGGAIQYVTVKPGKEFGGYAEATGGNFNRKDFEGALNIPLGDKLAARVSVGYNDRDGFVHDNFSNIDRGSDERKVGRLQLRWMPTDSLTIDLKGEMLSQESNGRASIVRGDPGSPFPTGLNDSAQFPVLARTLLLSPPGSVVAPTNPNPTTEHFTASDISPGEYTVAGFNAVDFSRLAYAAGSAVINWGLSDAVTLKSITGYNSTRTKSASDLDATPKSFLRSEPGPATVQDVFSEELQVVLGLLDDRLKWTTGVFYYDSQIKTPYGYSAFGLSPLRITDGTLSNQTSKAVFSQATFAFTDRLSGTLGLRYTEEDADSQAIDATLPILPTKKYGTTFNDTSPHMNVKFQATEDLMVYGSASKGFRAGGFGVNAGFVNGVKTFEPEKAWTYEIGARMEFLDRRLRVNPTVFLTDWKDVQVVTFVTVPEPGAECFGPPVTCQPNVAGVPQNVADARIKGLELETVFQATDRLSFQAAFAYLDTGYTRIENLRTAIYPFGLFLPPPNPLPTGPSPVYVPHLCDGNDPTIAQMNPTLTPAQYASQAALLSRYECQGPSPMKQAPKIKFSVGARYSYPLAAGSRLTTSLDYGWTDNQRSQVDNTGAVPLPEYGILNARVQYTSPNDRWSLAIFGTNLTDEYYYLGGTNYAKGYTPGATVFDPARPREYGATVRFNF